MALLALRSITCIDTAETFGDELYVTFNGTKRALPNMHQGETKPLNQEFIFQGSPELSLFENDGDHWYDRDDFIDKHTITESPADAALEFKATGGHGYPGHYSLSVSVTSEGPAPVTAILRLNSITCISQAEFFTDELYVTFNGTKRSLPNMHQGQTEPLSDEFIFQGTQELSLFENDGNHWYDRDDFIGKHSIPPSPTNMPLDFESHSGNAIGAHYILNVSVTPVGVPVAVVQQV
jgi:hypothetical protein